MTVKVMGESSIEIFAILKIVMYVSPTVHESNIQTN